MDRSTFDNDDDEATVGSPQDSTLHFPEGEKQIPIAPSETKYDLSDKDEVVAKFQLLAKDYLDAFEVRRQQYEDNWRVYDGMAKCMTNRQLAGEEKVRGVNTTDDQRAQLGSALFQRIIRQNAATLSATLTERPVPGRYVPIANEDVRESSEDARARGAQMNVLLKYTAQMDQWEKKLIDFSHSVVKYGNVPVLFYLNRKTSPVRKTRPITEMRDVAEIDQLSGMEIMVKAPVQVGEEVYYEQSITENWPSWKVLDPYSVFMDDRRGGDQPHDCVVIRTIRTKAEIYQDYKDGWFGKSTMEKLNQKQDEWDQTEGDEGNEDRMENRDLTTQTSDLPNYFMQYDVFMRVPISEGDWDDDNPPDVYWATFIGNELDGAACVRLTRNPDPDGEIPVRVIHALPDDGDCLYHVAPGDMIRSDYSAICTLMNQFLDNISNRLEAPFVAVEGKVRKTKDFTFGRNKVFWVDDPSALSWLGNQIADTTSNSIALIEYLQNNAMISMGFNQNELGRSFGARTSASEAQNIQGQSSLPSRISSKYIRAQLIPWMLRKVASYWEAYATDGQVIAISDMPKLYRVNRGMIGGEYDIQIELPDEYDDDVVQANKMLQYMQMLASVPALQGAVDWAEGARKLGMKFGIKDVSWIKGASKEDARTVAELENQMMMQGVDDEPMSGEDHATHLQIHRAKKLEYAGMEGQPGSEWIAQLLEPHIAKTEELERTEQGGGGAPMGQSPTMQLTPGAPPPSGSGNQSAGEVAGNDIAGAMGQLMGQS